MSRQKPHVLMLVPHWPPEGGAASARLSSFAAELQRLGHEVRVVAPEPSYLVPPAAGPALAQEGVRRVRVAARGAGALGNALHQWRLRSALKEGAQAELRDFRADVVLVSSPPPVAALAGTGLKKRDGTPLPLVVDVRDIWPDVLIEAGLLGARAPAAFVLRHVEARLLSRAAAVVAVTITKVERLRSRGARSPSCVPNGIEETWITPEPAYLGGAGSREPFVVLHAGNIGRAQDVGLLVRAVTAMSQGNERPLVNALLLGEGEERVKVMELARALGAPVTWSPPVPREAVKEALASCTCAVVTLRTRDMIDAVPSKLLDAMGRGVPVVLAAEGEAARLLREAGGGLVVTPGDVAGLARALVAMRDMTREQRVEMGARGRAHVLAHYRRRDAARLLSDVLSGACA